MKYIITESRLQQVALKYLNMQDMSVTKYANAIFFAENVGDKYGVLRYNTQDERLYIFGGFADYISNMFGLNRKETSKLITSWVEDNFDVGIFKTEIFDGNRAFLIPE